jgi:hypothetical protein
VDEIFIVALLNGENLLRTRALVLNVLPLQDEGIDAKPSNSDIRLVKGSHHLRGVREFLFTPFAIRHSTIQGVCVSFFSPPFAARYDALHAMMPFKGSTHAIRCVSPLWASAETSYGGRPQYFIDGETPGMYRRGFPLFRT